jgi:orotate phosphoribosyltransferase
MTTETGPLLARMLWEIGAVHFNAAEPYTFTSGLRSPVYIDCRKLISYPRVRSRLMDEACRSVLEAAGHEQFDVVAGGETAGIPFAAFMADRLGLPMIYVRKKPKGFGRNALIEGDFKDGARVLLVEDLTTDGGSKLKFAKAIREAGAQIAHTFAVFYYDIFKDTPDVMAKEGITLHHLGTWWDVLEEAKRAGTFDDKTLKDVESFLHGPREWSAANGGEA